MYHKPSKTIQTLGSFQALLQPKNPTHRGTTLIANDGGFTAHCLLSNKTRALVWWHR